MAEVLFKKVDYILKKLVEDISMGEIGLPDIQRPFVWSMTKVRDLFDSMYRGFPIGYLLFWENGSSDTHRTIGAGPKQKVARLLIVDGQQRLTSMCAGAWESTAWANSTGRKRTSPPTTWRA
jgi:uncharacterized protein with ParB-like and HNH nuclease domain